MNLIRTDERFEGTLVSAPAVWSLDGYKASALPCRFSERDVTAGLVNTGAPNSGYMPRLRIYIADDDVYGSWK